MKKYTHLFFDLDHTLWDLEKNSAETITELYEKHDLGRLGLKSSESFIEQYHQVNEFMWEQFRLGQIDKPTLRYGRFAQTFERFGIRGEEKLAIVLADDYIRMSPEKTFLMPGSLDTLNYLNNKYSMHIITNGFPEVQNRKLSASGISQFFDQLFISEEIGFKKPEKEIFHYAHSKTGAEKASSLMIGDNFKIDIIGAKNYGMDQVWFNPKKENQEEKPTYEITSISELTKFL